MCGSSYGEKCTVGFGAIVTCVRMAEIYKERRWADRTRELAQQWLDENSIRIDNRCAELMQLLIRLDDVEYVR